jgi:hypothetical protein
MNHTINLVCSVITLLAGAIIFGRYLWARRPVSETFDVDARSVVRSYSVYIDGQKIGTCSSAGLVLDSDGSQLSFDQIVPWSAPHFRTLLRAFRNGQKLPVAIGPIDNDMLELGMMRVQSLVVDTDMQSGTTTLDTTLSGPPLAASETATPCDETTVPATGTSTAN